MAVFENAMIIRITTYAFLSRIPEHHQDDSNDVHLIARSSMKKT